MESGLIQRIHLADVPLDSFDTTRMADFLAACRDDRNHQIILLDRHGLLQGRKRGLWRTMLQGAELVLPVSPSLPAAAARLGLPAPLLHEPFRFTVSLLTALEAREGSLFLVGADQRTLARAERTLRSTFPGLRIVGRQPGGFSHGEASTLMEAMRKTSPDLVLVAAGVPGGESWIPQAMMRVSGGIYLWCGTMLSRFSGRRPSWFHRVLGLDQNASRAIPRTPSRKPGAVHRAWTLLSGLWLALRVHRHAKSTPCKPASELQH